MSRVGLAILYNTLAFVTLGAYIVLSDFSIWELLVLVAYGTFMALRSKHETYKEAYDKGYYDGIDQALKYRERKGDNK